MGFLDKLKSTADDVFSAASDAVRDVSDKGKEMTEKSRLNKAIKNEDVKINNLYMIIGKKFFEANSTAPAGYEEQFNGIKNAMSEIERLKKDLDGISSALVCPKCGVKISAGQPFCQSCGTNLAAAASAAPQQPAPPVQNTQPIQNAQPVQPAEPEKVQAEIVQPNESENK